MKAAFERAARQVYSHLQDVAVLLGLVDLGDGAVRHRQIEFADYAHLLGKGDELERRTAALVAQPDQRLEVVDRAVAQVDDRLVDDVELGLGERRFETADALDGLVEHQLVAVREVADREVAALVGESVDGVEEGLGAVLFADVGVAVEVDGRGFDRDALAGRIGGPCALGEGALEGRDIESRLVDEPELVARDMTG